MTVVRQNRHHPLGKTCHHVHAYRMSCDQFDALRARAGGRCEICGTLEEDAPGGRLVVDHFDAGPDSFVRGLLCNPCNTGVMACLDGWKTWGANRAWEQRAREYEANSWQQPSPAARRRMAARRAAGDARPLA